MKPSQYILLITLTLGTLAHSGGLIKSGPDKGCHTNHSTNDFHCHQSTKSESKKSNYSRSLFGIWQDTNKDCKDTRAQLLIDQSQIPVVMNEKGCRVISGKWADFYYNEVLLKSSEIDIDHVVALNYAFYNGAENWDRKKRIAFGNDPDNLVITNLKYNRKKGARTPMQWLPLQKENACKYLKRWILVKNKYDLLINEEEIKIKTQVCGDSN